MTDLYTLSQTAQPYLVAGITGGIAGIAAGIGLGLCFSKRAQAKEQEIVRKQELDKMVQDMKESRIDPMARESTQAFDNSLYFHVNRFNATAIRITRPFRNVDGHYEICVVGKDKKFPDSPNETQTFARFTTVKSPSGYEVEQTYFAPFARFIGKLDDVIEEMATKSTYEIVKKYAAMASEDAMIPLQNGCGHKR